jgi:predicted nucleotidyltransferase
MTVDEFEATLVSEARDDPETLGLLLHGSRASDAHRSDSDYDLIRIVTEDAYSARLDRNSLLEHRPPGDAPKVDILFQSTARIESYVANPGWYTATYISARLLFDRSGEIAPLLRRLTAEAGKVARGGTAVAYDDYLNSFVRSIKAARRGDDLGRQLHSAGSAVALVRTLFGLESAWPPYHDQLAARLTRIERLQGWPRDYLGESLLRLTRDADPAFQQTLEQRVEQLMNARGIPHEWGGDLQPLKDLRFD